MADLLTLFAFFDCKDISKGLFKAYCDCCDNHEADTKLSRETSNPKTKDNLNRVRNTTPYEILNDKVSSTDVWSNSPAYTKGPIIVDEIANRPQSYNDQRIAQGIGSFLTTHKGN
jgi:hypothetical protein